MKNPGKWGAKNVMSFILLMGFLYVAGYWGCTRVFVGEFSGSTIKIRLFEHAWQLRAWAPLVWLEQSLRTDEFYGQVHSGASLPPAPDGKSD